MENVFTFLGGNTTPLVITKKQAEVTHEKLNAALEKVEDLKNLEENWDDEGGPAIAIDLIELATDWVKKIFILGNRTPYFIAPTVNSGVLLEYVKDNVRVDFRFEDDESYMTALIDGECFYNGDINLNVITKYLVS